jgi:hypothetical protein
VPHGQGVLLRDALEKAGVPVQFHTVRNGGHGGFNDPLVDRLVDEFLELKLKGKR